MPGIFSYVKEWSDGPQGGRFGRPFWRSDPLRFMNVSCVSIAALSDIIVLRACAGHLGA